MTKREKILAFLKADPKNGRLDDAEVAEQLGCNRHHVGQVRNEFKASQKHLRRVVSQLPKP
jgi:hypothetical protein